MITHLSLGTTPYRRTRNLHLLIVANKHIVAGNRKLKIYGSVSCSSGKRIKMENRVFFLSAREAEENGFRPCGHCMKEAYKNWKKNNH